VVPERLEREIVIKAPVEIVWAVITEPGHINGWFGDLSEIELRPGGRLWFRWEGDDNAVHGRVERVEPPHRFSFRWNRGSGTEVREANSTLVEFSLHEEGDATRLTVVESGFRDLAWPEDEKQRDAEDHREGWERELAELVEYVGRL
jgi:uncharacterized protein YndB with AHSA1/START domain